MMKLSFPCKKIISIIEMKNNICINVFGCEDELVFPIYIADQKFKDSVDLLLLIDDDKSHDVYIKDFDRFIFHKTKSKNKKWFCKSFLQCFGSENVVTIEFEHYSKKIPVPFKIYADFECNVRSVENYEGSYTKKHQDHVPCSFAYKVVCIDDRFTKPIVVYRGENAAYEFIKAILKKYKYCKKVMKKRFNKNWFMSE